MPLYEYECNVCGFVTEEIRRMKERNKAIACKKCGCAAERIVSTFTAVSDTNFGFTGKVDTRLGDKPIEGRQDYKQRMKEQGLIEVDKHYGEKLSTLEDRMKPFQITPDLMKNG